MNWTISIFHYEGQDYVGIDETDEPSGMTMVEADAACVEYAKQRGLPLFAEFRQEENIQLSRATGERWLEDEKM